jgi:hypothetical protein
MDASNCLLHVGMNRMLRMYWAAWHDSMDTRELVRELQQLPGSKLSVEWRDDGAADERIFSPSGELMLLLKPFRTEFARIWAEKPDWQSSRT